MRKGGGALLPRARRVVNRTSSAFPAGSRSDAAQGTGARTLKAKATYSPPANFRSDAAQRTGARTPPPPKRLVPLTPKFKPSAGAKKVVQRKTAKPKGGGKHPPRHSVACPDKKSKKKKGSAMDWLFPVGWNGLFGGLEELAKFQSEFRKKAADKARKEAAKVKVKRNPVGGKQKAIQNRRLQKINDLSRKAGRHTRAAGKLKFASRFVKGVGFLPDIYDTGKALHEQRYEDAAYKAAAGLVSAGVTVGCQAGAVALGVGTGGAATPLSAFMVGVGCGALGGAAGVGVDKYGKPVVQAVSGAAKKAAGAVGGAAKKAAGAVGGAAKSVGGTAKKAWNSIPKPW